MKIDGHSGRNTCQGPTIDVSYVYQTSPKWIIPSGSSHQMAAQEGGMYVQQKMTYFFRRSNEHEEVILK